MKNLAYCVSLIQLDRQDFSPKNYQRYLQYAINTYKEEISMGIDPSVEVMYATPDSIGCVDMPQDYEYYTKVAININGIVFTLSRNDNMPLNRRTDTCGDEVDDALIAPQGDIFTTFNYGFGYQFAGHYRAGNYVGELYGMGGGFNRAGYFTEDWKMRRFQFTNVPIDREVVIEYVSNGANVGSLVDDLAVPVIRYGVHDQLAMFENGGRSNFFGTFRQAVLDYRVAKTTPTIEDYLDSRYRTFKSSPKR